MKQNIVTTNEFVYDVLNNMVHHNEIVLNKKDVEDSRALKHIMSRLKDTFTTEEDGELLILRKVRKLDANIKFQKIR